MQLYENTKKKTIIIIIVVAVIVVLGIVGGIVARNISIKKENERVELATQKAQLALENYIETLKAEDEEFDENDLFGYTFIVDLGDKYSDYLFMYEKTNQLELKDKVNFNKEAKTVLNKDKSEYKLLTPMGERASFKKYSAVAPEEYNVEEVSIWYGNIKMGFIEKEEIDNDHYDNDLIDDYDQGGYDYDQGDELDN